MHVFKLLQLELAVVSCFLNLNCGAVFFKVFTCFCMLRVSYTYLSLLFYKVFFFLIICNFLRNINPAISKPYRHTIRFQASYCCILPAPLLCFRHLNSRLQSAKKSRPAVLLPACPRLSHCRLRYHQ